MISSIKTKKQPPFLFKLLFFIIVLFFLDLAIGYLLKYFYFKQDSGILYRTTYAIDSTKADVLIFGSSTANHHYIPELFNKKMYLSCYNTGRDGNSILFSYAVLKGVLKRYNPEMIILDINPGEFQEDQDSYDRISSLLPYYDTHPEIRSIIQLKSSFEKYKLISKIYPFNSLLFTIAVGNADFNKDRELINDENGYVPLKNTWNEPLDTDTSIFLYKLDSTKIEIFKSFINECHKSNVRLYVFLSPKFIQYKHEDPTVEIVNRICTETNIPFYSFRNDSFFLKHENLFDDKGHLNAAGAKIYTGIVIDKITNEHR